MKTKTYNKPLILLYLLAFFALIVQQAVSQDLVNLSTGTILNIGNIVFVNDDSHFTNENATAATAYVGDDGTNSGTITFTGQNAASDYFDGGQPLGLTDAFRVTGWTMYNYPTADQNLQGAYYSNLVLADGAAFLKVFGAASFYVDHVYTASGGNRNYTGSSFYYDGDVNGTEDQTIFPESGASAASNRYDNLFFTNSGVKTLETGDVNYAETSLTVDANAYLVINGQQYSEGTTTTDVSGAEFEGQIDIFGAGALFQTGDGAGALDGNMYIYDDGAFLTGGTGTAVFSGVVNVGDESATGPFLTTNTGSFTVGTGDVTIDDGAVMTLHSGAAGILTVMNARTFKITGTANFENAVTWNAGTALTAGSDRDNVNYDDGSIVNYDGSDDVEGASYDNPYGILSITGATIKKIENTTTANLSGDFWLKDADFYADGDGTLNDGASGGILSMLDETASATYAATGHYEVAGTFRRFINSSTSALTFNNEATEFSVNENAASLQYLDLSIWKGVAPVGAEPNASDVDAGSLATTDVKRQTIFDYEQTAGDWVSTLRLGFLQSEVPAGLLTNLHSLRFRDVVPAGVSEKLSTGDSVIHYVDNFDIEDPDPNGFAWAELSNINPTGGSATLTSAEVADGNELFLRGGPTWFITINPGRWSNPNTWDEGVQPGPYDYCKVRHTVHAGFVRPSVDNYLIDETIHLAGWTKDATEMAAFIWVYQEAGAAGFNGMLMLGGVGGGVNEADKDWGITNAAGGATDLANPPVGTQGGNDYTGFNLAGTIIIDTKVANLTTGQGSPPVAANTLDAATNLDITLTKDSEGNADNFNGGLLLFNGATFTLRSGGANYGEINNGGTIQIGE